MFNKDWLYLTFLSRGADTSVRVKALFKPPYAKKKLGKPRPVTLEVTKPTPEPSKADGADNEAAQQAQVMRSYTRGFDLELLEDLINDRSCTSKEKMQKLRLFAKKIREDETLLFKMRLVADEIRQQRQDAAKANRGMTLTSPDLVPIETLFNPVSAEEAAENEGVFIARNLNIAPFYQQYRQEKRKILGLVGVRRQLNANSRKTRDEAVR